MIRLSLAAAAVVALAGCASDYGYGGYGGYGGFDGGYASAYYDDAYGPYYDGYWGSDGVFWYRPAVGRPYVRDTGHHFRREAASGYHSVRARRHHDRDHDRDHDADQQ